MRHILSPSAALFHADCRDALRQLPDNSIDSCVTDPPYALVSIVKRFGSPNAEPAKGNEAYMRASAGFMGKSWDTGECAMDPTFWVEVLRVLKPGAHLVAFGASRGYHRMACAIEDAGFEIRDQIMWLYGSGFPKSLDVSKAIDRAAGKLAPEGQGFTVAGYSHNPDKLLHTAPSRGYVPPLPATPEAERWQGWGTALKPAHEPIVVARKPLSEPTVAANVLKWRTGALNIGACRVSTTDKLGGGGATTNVADGWDRPFRHDPVEIERLKGETARKVAEAEALGRWPANVVHDGSDEVVGAFPSTAPAKAGNRGLQHSGRHGGIADIGGNIKEGTDTVRGHSDNGGSAARFFYSAKASKQDRNGSKHPTVKPISLMEWLCTLITPPGGTVLDPFAGSGTTGIAAQNKGFQVVLCEREAEYVTDIKARFAGSSPGERHQYRNLRTAETTWQQEQ